MTAPAWLLILAGIGAAALLLLAAGAVLAIVRWNELKELLRNPLD